MANLPKDTDTPRRTSVPYVTARIHAHTLPGNAKHIKISQSAATTRHANSYTRQSATPQRGGGALYSADDLCLVATDTCNQNQTTDKELSSILTPTQEENHTTEGTHQPLRVWLEPLPPEVETRHRRHIDVSQDPRYDRVATASDSEWIEAPTRIPECIQPLETQEALF